MTLRHRILALLVHLLVVPWFALRPKLRAGLWQRFWWRPRVSPAAPGSLRVWAHGASAGDVLCLQPLIEELARRRPVDLVVTAFTDSGTAMARQRFADAQVFFQPLDLPGATRRAATAIHADLLLLERAELWPAMMIQAAASGARVAVVNGLLSPGHVATYRRVFRLVGRALDSLDLLLVRDADAARRAAEFGAAPERVHVTGNTKLDGAARVPESAAVQRLGEELGLAPGQPIAVAGSTHAGEEGLLLDAFQALLPDLSGARLILAPRYLERSDEVAGLVSARGLGLARRSLGERPDDDRPVLLLDSLGELGRAYGLARVAFVGGSLVPRGGQNMLEPAALGVPVLAGPHTEHARDQLTLLRGHGLVEIADGTALTRELGRLLGDPDAAGALGQRAREAVEQGSGASGRCAELLLAGLDAPDPRTDT